MKDMLSMVKEVHDYERKKFDKEVFKEQNLDKACRSRNLTASIKQLFNNRNGSKKV